MRHIAAKNVPFVTLRGAIDRLSGLFGDSPTVALSAKDAMTRLGYGSDPTAGRRLIGTLVAYGLVEENAAGQLDVTHLGRRILHPANQFEHDAALVDAADMPPLFRALREHFADRAFDREELGHWLRRRGLDKSSLDDAIHIFCKTTEFVREPRRRATEVVAAVTARQLPAEGPHPAARSLEATDLDWE